MVRARIAARPEDRRCRLGISVEGRTEEAFVNHVLAEHLRPLRIDPFPVVLGRARGRGQGGHVTIERIVWDMLALRKSFDAVTSLVDFYGFADKEDRTVEAIERHLCNEIKSRAPKARLVFPYVQRHEFEGLLFSDVEAFRAAQASDLEIKSLAGIRKRFDTPEDINDDPVTAPSKQIARIVPRYRKRFHGPKVAQRAGLARIREECPRFHDWLSRLEELGV